MDSREMEQAIKAQADLLIELAEKVNTQSAITKVLLDFAEVIISTHPRPGLLGKLLVEVREGERERALPTQVSDAFLDQMAHTFDRLVAVAEREVSRRDQQ